MSATVKVAVHQRYLRLSSSDGAAISLRSADDSEELSLARGTYTIDAEGVRELYVSSNCDVAQSSVGLSMVASVDGVPVNIMRWPSGQLRMSVDVETANGAAEQSWVARFLASLIGASTVTIGLVRMRAYLHRHELTGDGYTDHWCVGLVGYFEANGSFYDLRTARVSWKDYSATEAGYPDAFRIALRAVNPGTGAWGNVTYEASFDDDWSGGLLGVGTITGAHVVTGSAIIGGISPWDG